MASFEAVAEEYDEGRPSYPAGVFDALGSLTGLSVLDVGAGTGIATRQLLQRDASVTALDPGIEVLRRACRRTRDLPAIVADGAVLPFTEASFDLVCFAQSWHWLNPATRCSEVHRVLREGGRWAGWWSHARADGSTWFDACWTHIEAACPGTNRERRDIDWGESVAVSGLFDVESRVVVPWIRTLSVDGWMTDQISHSYIAHLPFQDRTQLLSSLRATLRDAFPDGEMSVRYETWLWIAERRNTPLEARQVDTHVLQ
jgi:SAM-dependent methyltransferase